MWLRHKEMCANKLILHSLRWYHYFKRMHDHSFKKKKINRLLYILYVHCITTDKLYITTGDGKYSNRRYSNLSTACWKVQMTYYFDFEQLFEIITI